MKKLVFIFFAAGLLTACGNDSTTNDETGAGSAPVTPGIDNVNGSIPDTSTTLRLNTPLPTDSLTGTEGDTLRR